MPGAEPCPLSFATFIDLCLHLCERAEEGDRVGYEEAARELPRYIHLATNSIVSARCFADISSGLGIAVEFKHRPTKNQPARNPRLLNPLFFAAVLLMAYAGLRVRFLPTKGTQGKALLFLRLEVPNSRAPGRRIYLSRVIRDTPKDRRTPFAKDHHDYRYESLAFESPDARLPPPDLGRAEAVALAVELYASNERHLNRGFLPDFFEGLLRGVLETATRFHGGAA